MAHYRRSAFWSVVTASRRRCEPHSTKLAQRGTPNVSNLVEHDRQVEWPTQMLRPDVRNTEVPSVAFAETHDLLPLIAWLHKSALIAALDPELDPETADPPPCSATDRNTRAAD